jgi:hypothetical protein
VNNDSVLDSSAKPQLSVLNDTEITASEPSITDKALIRCSRVIAILYEQHRPTELELTRLAIWKNTAAVVRRGDPHFKGRICPAQW